MKTPLKLLLLALLGLPACLPQVGVTPIATATASAAPTQTPTATPAPPTPTQVPGEIEPALKLEGRDIPLDVAGITVIPHAYSPNILMDGNTSGEGGALIQIFVKNRNHGAQDNAKLWLVPEGVFFNGTAVQDLLDGGLAAWSNATEKHVIAAGNLDVYALNMRDARLWGGGDNGVLNMRLDASGKEEYILPVGKPDVYVSRIVFTSRVGSLTPNGALVYLRNESAEAWEISSVDFWVPSISEEGTRRGWQQGVSASAIVPFAADGKIPPGELGGAKLVFTSVPLAEVIVEVQVTNGRETRSLFNQVRAYISNFDIGAGWLADSENRTKPLKSETFLKTLKLLYVNTARIPETPGYSDDLYNLYPLKMLWALGLPKYSSDKWLPKVHGNVQGGDPLCLACAEARSPQELAGVFAAYGSDRFPMTLTLANMLKFNDYAGLGDFPNFIALRVNAPSADDWQDYSERWGGQAIEWGAPLETVGDVTRLLAAANLPKPIAAWSQAASATWTDDYDGRERKSPTPLEIRIQNYEALANGATSIYWYSLENKALICYRDTIEELRREGREMSLIGDLLAQSAPYAWQRRDADIDLNVLAGPDFAILFAIDLTYTPDAAQKVFMSNGARAIEETFTLPAYLQGDLTVFKVDADGIHDVAAVVQGQNIVISDEINTTGVYIVTMKSFLKPQLSNKHIALLESENSYGFDPAGSDKDFAALIKGLGYRSFEAACGGQ